MSFFSEVEKTIEREFRKWTQKAFGPAQSDELLIVHHAILEEVASKIRTVRRGKQVFPFNHLLVRFAAPDAAQYAFLEGAFSENRRLESDIRECLTSAGCELPAGFSVDIEAAGTGPQTYEILFENRSTPPHPAATPTHARLIVLRGKANQDSFQLETPRTNIGRLAELTDSRQRVVRRNDIVFEEGADEANATVSRSHAHIRFDRQAADYRICDDASEYGTRIFRDGRSIEVPSGSARGERLSDGDEIYLGRACFRFEA
jgi:hypothetical protein